MDTWPWTSSHEDGLSARDAAVDGASAAMSLFRFQVSSNSTSALINEERYGTAKSIRTSTLILACLNAVAALATAATIFWDSRVRSRRRRQSGFWLTSGGLGLLRGRDAFPFILSVGIVIQAAIFAGAQSTGLQALLVLGCTVTSQLMFPAVFIVPYLQLVFGVEIAIRALGPGTFKPPRRWTSAVCIAVVALLLLAHVLVAQFIRPPSLCFASLFWFLQRYAVACFGLFVGIPAALALATAGIVLRLKRDTRINLEQRMTASRMVYHMAVAIITDLLLLPFFYNLAFLDQRDAGPLTLQLSLVSAVAANVSGIMTGGLYLFLRSNTLSTIGGDSSRPQQDASGEAKRGLRIVGLGSFRNNNHTNNTNNNTRQAFATRGRPAFLNLARTESTMTLVVSEERTGGEEEAIIESPVIPPESIYDSVSPRRGTLSPGAPAPSPLRPPRPSSLRPPSPISGDDRNSNDNGNLMIQLTPDDDPQTPYSPIFPAPLHTTPSVQSIPLLPPTTYTPPPNPTRQQRQQQQQPSPAEDATTTLVPLPVPPLSFYNTAHHNRNSSMSTSTTVQIGLRLSNVEDMAPQARYLRDTGTVYSISGSGADPRLTLVPPPPLMARRPGPLSIVRGYRRQDDGDDGGYHGGVEAEAEGAARSALPSPSSVYPGEEASRSGTGLGARSPRGPPRIKLTSPRGVGFTQPQPRSAWI